MRPTCIGAMALVLSGCASFRVSDPVVNGNEVVVSVVRNRCPWCGEEPFVVRCTGARCRWQALGGPEDAVREAAGAAFDNGARQRPEATADTPAEASPPSELAPSERARDEQDPAARDVDDP